MSEENKTLSRRVLEEVFSAGNLDVVDEIYSEEHVHHDPAMPEEGHGREHLKEFASMYRSAFPDVQIEIEDQIAEGDRVATRWVARGTHQGDLMGISPTGNRVTVAGTTFDRIAGGQIAETWDNYDALGMMQQVGAIPSAEETQAQGSQQPASPIEWSQRAARVVIPWRSSLYDHAVPRRP